jgi:hypothetical protein
MPTTRRILWTGAVGLAGFLIGGSGSGIEGIWLGSLWGAGIGYGFGSIFDQTSPTKRIVAYWSFTLALVALFFGLLIGGGARPNPSNSYLTWVGVSSSLAGALLGSAIGAAQFARFKRKLQGSGHDEATNSTAILTKAPRSGLAILAGYVAILLLLFWIARAHRMEIPDAVGLAIICFSFGWTYLAIWKLLRGGRKLGWNRSNLTKLLTGPRPDDPDELFIWQWTLQLCCAILSVVVCVAALSFLGSKP